MDGCLPGVSLLLTTATTTARKAGGGGGGSFSSISAFFTGGGNSPPRDQGKLAATHPSRLPPLGSSQPMRERAKYIPVRLSYDQRKSLRLVEAALAACDYTAR